MTDKNDARIILFREHAQRNAELYRQFKYGVITEEQFNALSKLSLDYCNDELKKLGKF